MNIVIVGWYSFDTYDAVWFFEDGVGHLCTRSKERCEIISLDAQSEGVFNRLFANRLLENPNRSLTELVKLAHEDVLEDQANENEALRLAEAGLSNY